MIVHLRNSTVNSKGVFPASSALVIVSRPAVLNRLFSRDDRQENRYRRLHHGRSISIFIHTHTHRPDYYPQPHRLRGPSHCPGRGEPSWSTPHRLLYRASKRRMRSHHHRGTISSSQ